MERTPVPAAYVPFPFGIDFQAKLVRVMLMDAGLTDAVLRYVKPEYFESPPLRWAVEQIRQHRDAYNTVPSIMVLQENVRDLDPAIRTSYSQAILQLQIQNIPEEGWIKDQVLDWVKRNVFVEAYSRTKNLYNQGSVTEAYDVMSKAMDQIRKAVWTKVDRGWLFEEVGTREGRRERSRSLSGLVTSGIMDVDKLLGGGAELGFLGIWMAYSAGGKALADAEPVLTPTGWVPISQLRVGDLVVGGSTGKPCRVTGVFPQGVKPCSEVCFSDGARLVASDDHLWKYADRQTRQWRGDTWNIFTTKQLQTERPSWAGDPEIPLVPEITFGSHQEKLPLDPYLLGLLLGDGSFCSPTISFTKPEIDLQETLAARLPDGDSIGVNRREGTISIIGNRFPERSRTARCLESLGLWGLKSRDKFIPDVYRWAPPNARWDLLCGLCDTDGYVAEGRYSVEYSSGSKTLADDVIWLARSLGGIVRSRVKIVNGRQYWIVRMRFMDRIPVTSSKHTSKIHRPTLTFRRTITAITSTSAQSCTCITVDDPESLFVTRDFVVTHNSIMLQNNGVAAARSFKKTLHFVLEGNRSMIEDRYDACFADEVYSAVKAGNLGASKYAQLHAEYQMLRGLLVLRGFTDRWDVTINDIASELSDLRRNYGWVPEVIVIDYGDLVGGRQEKYGATWESDRGAYRDMKSLANQGYVVWTASQVQRPKIKNHTTIEHVLTSRDIAGGYDKFRVADFVASLNSTMQERENKVMRLFPEKVRDAGGGDVITIGADFSKMKFGISIDSPLGYGSAPTGQVKKIPGFSMNECRRAQGLAPL